MKDKLTDYFNGNLSYEEELRVQQWLAQNAESEQVAQEMEKLFDSCANSASEPSRQAFLYNAIQRRLSLRGVRSHGRRIAFYAASAFASLAICLIFFSAGSHVGRLDAGSVEWIEERVPFASSRDLQLSDGTLLSLAPGTRITYPDRFVGAERRIFVDGEIFASVAKDIEHPFIIASEGTQVKVLGTTFNFKSFSESSEVELSLIEGSVQMHFNSSNTSRQVMVSPGERIRYDRKTSELRRENFNADTYRPFFADASYLYYNNMRLQDIASDLVRRFDRKIVITDEKLSQSNFFAIFTNNESLDQILGTMAMNHDMSVTLRDGTYYIGTNNNK